MKLKMIAGVCVFIREHVLDDRGAYGDWQCDPQVSAFVSWLPKTEEESYESLQEAIEQQGMEDRARFFMAVVRHEDQEVVGDVGITLLSEGEGDIGWFIRKKYWGRGYGSEAATLMISCGFKAIGLDTIRASCRRGNTRSERIMKKRGFRLTDATEKRLSYSLTYKDWDAGPANDCVQPAEAADA